MATQRPENEGDDLPPGLGKPAQRALAAAGIRRLDQLTGYRENEVLRLHGMGPKALGLLGESLHARGLAFAPEEAK